MTMEGKTFSMEKILINLIPGSSLSFRVSVKWLVSHSMVILIPTDLRMNEMMLKWPFSHSAMVVNDWNEGGMMKFLNQGICPRFFSFSFCPHFTNVPYLNTHCWMREIHGTKSLKVGVPALASLRFSIIGRQGELLDALIPISSKSHSLYNRNESRLILKWEHEVAPLASLLY